MLVLLALAMGRHQDAAGHLEHAIVIKGGMQPMTRATIRFYLSTMPDVGVVFSHNVGCGGSAGELGFLNELLSVFPLTGATFLEMK